ncbi:MAG: type II toxin-antitoxin system prevent-host-death family antitoxin [Actinomycetaceae bacterium]|nr:type II toxin-antitoxin system prevent-host-death family antitoxin [Actinomycetaceae bacterium]
METMTSDQARSSWGLLMDTVAKRPVEITRRGRRGAVVIDPELYDLAMAALEDRIDAAGAQMARSEGGPRISAADLRRELGL